MSRLMSKKLVLGLVATSFILGSAPAQTGEISLRSIDGHRVNLRDLRGKVVVLSFSGTWIPLASKELPALQKVADRYSARGVQVYWVSINSEKQGARTFASDADLQAFAQKFNLRLTVLRDPEQEAYRAFGLDALPTVIILDRQGKVAHKHVGFGQDSGEAYSEIIRDLEQLLKE